jgi:hypothetical protein
MLNHCGDGYRAAGLNVCCDVSQLREGLLRHLLDEDVQNPAAGQAYRERVVVAYAVALQHRTTIH